MEKIQQKSGENPGEKSRFTITYWSWRLICIKQIEKTKKKSVKKSWPTMHRYLILDEITNLTHTKQSYDVLARLTVSWSSKSEITFLTSWCWISRICFFTITFHFWCPSFREFFGNYELIMCLALFDAKLCFILKRTKTILELT